MKNVYLLLLFCCFAQVAVSQSNSSLAYHKLADSLYSHHNYQHSATYYEKAIVNSAHPGVAMLGVARSNIKLNKIKEAEVWYEKAHANRASFTNEDIYQYVHVLMMLQKREAAEAKLRGLLKEDKYALFAQQTLDDIQNVSKYYKDSADFSVSSLSINTTESEFGPAYYKEGIVFSASKPESIKRKKYHWDNTHFLNVYYSVKQKNESFKKPELFDKELNTRFHDGPVTFHSSGKKIIVTRNHAVAGTRTNGTKVQHLGLYEGEQGKDNKWILRSMSFNDSTYSIAHPSVNDDGTILYFASDKPGGYGGTDIYRVTRTNGVWSRPFNLGPVVNTPGNEVFPFIVGNTLYFASNGRGGLGGLDIFKSSLEVNGFNPPVNLGAPFNSNFDDFALISTPDQRSGYFASSRKGNDDIYSFKKDLLNINLLAHTYDGLTKEDIAEANIEILTTPGADVTTSSDGKGLFQFQLPEETAFIVMATKDDKSGLLPGVAKLEEDHLHLTHQLPLYADTSRVPCIGFIKNEEGITQNASKIFIKDETTGEVLAHAQDHPLVSFLGEKGHTYKVQITNENGDVTTHELQVPMEKRSETWTMVLKETIKTMKMAARVFKAADQTPLGGADVKIITFSEADQDLVADENGVVEFTLTEGTAYVVMGTKDGLSGMHSGVAEKGAEKASIIHPVPAYGDPEKTLPVMALVTDKKGEPLNYVKAIVTEKETGERIPVEIKDGVLTFLGEKGKEYNLNVEHKGYESVADQISIPANAVTIEKVSVVMNEVKPGDAPAYLMAARVFRASDNTPLSNAEVKIITFTDPDQDLVADSLGLVDFTLPEGTAYVVMGTKGALSGMHSGIVEPGTDKASIVHPVPAHGDPEKQLPVYGRITNNEGEVLTKANVVVKEKESGAEIPVQVKEGILSFYGEKGKEYDITVDHLDHKPEMKLLQIPSQAASVERVSIELDKEVPSILYYQMAAKAFKAIDSTVLSNASIKIITFSEPDVELIADEKGVVEFKLEEGMAYVVMATKDGFSGMHSGIVEPRSDKAFVIHPIPAYSDEEKQLPVFGRITNKSGQALEDATVLVKEKGTGNVIPVQVRQGILTFQGEKGKEYDIAVDHEDHVSAVKTINISPKATAVDRVAFALDTREVPVAPFYRMAARIYKADDMTPLSHADVKIITFSEPDVELTANAEGIVEFTLEEGMAYVVVGSKDGFTGMHSGVVEPRSDRAFIIHPVPAYGDPEKQLSVLGRVINKNGELIENAKVIVTDKETGTIMPVQWQDGLMNFYGEKGKSYDITIQHRDYDEKIQTVAIPAQGTSMDKISLVLDKKVVTTTPAFTMAARVFKAADQSPLANAEVKIITFSEDDQELVANSEGVVDFILPEGIAYIVLGSKDGLSGMHSGIVEKGTDKASVIHPVAAVGDNPNEVPIIGLVADEEGRPLDQAKVEVTDKTSGEKMNVVVKDGVFSLAGKKGTDYVIAVTANNYQKNEKQLSVPATASNTQAVKFVLHDKSELKIPANASVLVVNSNNDTPRYYITSKDVHYEIIEKDGVLYLSTPETSKSMGRGSLADLKGDPMSYLSSRGFPVIAIIEIPTIYFDFNQALLDSLDNTQLNKVTELMVQYPDLKLIVNAHADDRGKETYNYNLSRKRAKVIVSYLSNHSINAKRLMMQPYGESHPFIDCATINCSEEQHEKNRRAEFAFQKGYSMNTAFYNAGSNTSTTDYSALLQSYGNKTVADVVFKVSVGAYRFTPKFDFNSLQDLGKIESTSIKGITYFYLYGYNTFQQAEDVRQQVIKRGVTDATVSIFYKDKNISFSKFKTLD